MVLRMNGPLQPFPCSPLLLGGAFWRQNKICLLFLFFSKLTLIAGFASFQFLQKLFTTREWKLDKTDKRQTKCVVSLQLALPQKALHLLTVNMKSFLEWLSAP